MIISCIVAATENGVIGRDNDIPWYLSDDLKFFKKTTLGHHIIMGRNCFESIGKPLPKRTNIVITRNPYYIISNCIVTHSIEEALSHAYENGEEEVFIIGGGQIYHQSSAIWDKLYLTRVHTQLDGDVHFPALDLSEWTLTSEERHPKNEKNDFDYSFLEYKRN